MTHASIKIFHTDASFLFPMKALTQVKMRAPCWRNKFTSCLAKIAVMSVKISCRKCLFRVKHNEKVVLQARSCSCWSCPGCAHGFEDESGKHYLSSGQLPSSVGTAVPNTQRSTSETYVMWVSFCPWSHKASNKVKHASMDGKFFFPLKYLGPCINNTIHFSCYFMHWHAGALYFLPERYLRGVVIAVILDINFLCWERQNS